MNSVTTQSTRVPKRRSRPGAPPLLTERIAAGRHGAKTGAGFYDWPAAELAALREDREGA